ncbi:hypothetical protein V5E43_000688 [Yersinia enterocolitica]|uniref:hypothetical protein n=1 Tax=Yersinia TaxID=629 RepID=UPI0005E3E5A0|nr:MULTISPECIES: hypothetical protein [Yersinia]MCW6576433.1 hypothetical protein [Yersinia ruckeri]CQH79160.1 Uncharacterised protein [Yersinia enterocolitica]
MRIEVSNLLYDKTDPRCKCHLAESQGLIYAFIQALHMGIPEKSHVTRYWGRHCHDTAEQSIRDILTNGEKWPIFPKSVVFDNLIIKPDTKLTFGIYY